MRARRPEKFGAALLAVLAVLCLLFFPPEAQAKRITRSELEAAARSLGVEPCVLRAVLEVESGGYGFLPSGKPKIVFEGHVFWKNLEARGIDPAVHARNHPAIVFPKWTKAYYRHGEKEYDRLEEAMAINRQAALRATLWGAFQILGANYKACGFSNIESFVEAQKAADGQLRSFIAYLTTRGLVEPLRQKDWARFARGYNGPSYAKHKYDKKLEAAYKRCRSR